MIQNVGFESEDIKTRHCLKAEGMCIAHGAPQWCKTYKVDETYIFFEENLMGDLPVVRCVSSCLNNLAKNVK